MADLYLVPKREPDAAEKILARVRSAPRPDGMLQCPRCGGQATCRIEAGVVIANGRRKRGTVIHKDICAICLEIGRLKVQMLTGNEKPVRVK